MKMKYYRVLFTMFLGFLVTGISTAQFDDIYFNPEDADEAYAAVDLKKYYDESATDTKAVEDDYEYYYSSRIKRFDRPFYGFDFYSPVYVDPFYYNPAYAGFYRPGSSIYWGGYYPAPVSYSSIYVSSGFGYGYPAYSTFGSFGYNTYGVSPGGFYGGGFPGSYNGYGASFGGGGFYGGGYGGGYNAYCPPAIGTIYGNPAGGIYRPDGTLAGSSRGGSTTARPAYGPRGGSGATTSGSTNGGGVRPGTSESFPDRPLTSSTQTARNGQRTTGTSPREVSYTAPRNERPTYSPPSATTSRANPYTSTRSSASATRSESANRFSSSRPTRPTSTYRPTSNTTSSSWSSPRSSSSSRSNFSSPSSSSSRSSFSTGSSSRSSSSGARSSSSAGRSSGGRGN